MIEEVAEMLAVTSGGHWVDATVGGGAMTEMLLQLSAPGGVVLGLDRDAEALELAAKRLAVYGPRLLLRHSSFSRLPETLAELNWSSTDEGGVNGIVADLGLSSLQLADSSRGFSFSTDGPLDMRMDRTAETTAAGLANRLGEKELANLIFRYGQDRSSRAIARAIVKRRAASPLRTTTDLRDCVLAAGVRGRPGHDPATRTFQAFRIAVNGEIESLEKFLDEAWALLTAGGRMVLLTYHSLEDRLVKHTFRRLASDCICPPHRPICDCDWQAKVRVITKRKRRPSDEEVERNPRARSGGLRAVERLGD